MTNQPQKGLGYVHVTHFCMLKCELEKISTQYAIN